RSTQHVYFVDDVDAIASLRGRDVDFVDDVFAHVIDAGVGGSVDFDQVHHRLVGSDARAKVALVAGSTRGAFFAVKAFGEQARRGGFAGTARAAEKVGVGDA